MRQGLFFCALLFVFSVVAVVRAGATDQGSSVKSSFLAIFLNGRFSQEFQPNTADDNFPGNSLDNNHQDIPFADVASASESLEYFARLLDNLNAAALVETTSMNPESAQFSSWAVGMVLGAPILKQWRVDTTYVADNNSKSAHSGQRRCAVSPKLVVQPPCAQGFASTSLRDMPANLPHKSVLAAAYTWRALPGDLPWKVGEDNDEYPAGAYSLELPLVNAAVQTGTPFQENNVNDVELNAAELVRTLASHGWADSATRGISLEVAFYNPSRNRLSAVQLLAELRDGVGVRAEHRLRMHKVNTWNFRPSPAGGKKQVILSDIIFFPYIVNVLPKANLQLTQRAALTPTDELYLHFFCVPIHAQYFFGCVGIWADFQDIGGRRSGNNPLCYPPRHLRQSTDTIDQVIFAMAAIGCSPFRRTCCIRRIRTLFQANA
jgi:hypothetical protein